MSGKGKFLIVALSILALAGIAMLVLALCLGWDIVGGLTHPVAVVCYVFAGCALISIVAYLINKKIREG